MPSILRGVISSVDQVHIGLASGVAISALQICSSLGVAVVGGIFYGALGTGDTLAAYAHAFILVLGCNVALLALGGVLSLRLPGGMSEGRRRAGSAP
jgi:hypothetical protein